MRRGVPVDPDQPVFFVAETTKDGKNYVGVGPTTAEAILAMLKDLTGMEGRMSPQVAMRIEELSEEKRFPPRPPRKRPAKGQPLN